MFLIYNCPFCPRTIDVPQTNRMYKRKASHYKYFLEYQFNDVLGNRNARANFPQKERKVLVFLAPPFVAACLSALREEINKSSKKRTLRWKML